MLFISVWIPTKSVLQPHTPSFVRNCEQALVPLILPQTLSNSDMSKRFPLCLHIPCPVYKGLDMQNGKGVWTL